MYIFTSYHSPIVKAPVWQTRSLENPKNKLLWGSISDFKSTWWTEASHTSLKEKLLLEVKLTERKAALLKQNNQEEKDWNIAFRDTIPALSVYKKVSSEALMKNWNLIKKTNHYLAKILKNHLKFSFFEKGKLWQRTCLLEPKHKRDRCAACHPLLFFTKNNLSIQKARVHNQLIN